MKSVFRCSNPKPGEQYYLSVALEDGTGVAVEDWADDFEEAKAKALPVLVSGGRQYGEMPSIPDEYQGWFTKEDLKWAKEQIEHPKIRPAEPQ